MGKRKRERDVIRSTSSLLYVSLSFSLYLFVCLLKKKKKKKGGKEEESSQKGWMTTCTTNTWGSSTRH